MPEVPTPEAPNPIKPMTGFRWTVCTLVFFATTVNYLDRQMFAQLVPFFEDDLKLGPMDIALINVSFILPYGFAMLFVGRFIDKVGIRRGLASAFFAWNVASICHAFISSLTGFMGMRFMLGVAESGMYPGAVKTMADWFPVKERSIANGIFNAGANLGAVLAPILGVALALRYGWRTCFIVTGSIGLVWLIFWKIYYHPLPDANSADQSKHPWVSDSELAYIRSDQGEPTAQITYSQLFGMRPVYGLAIAKALTDGPSWFILLWLPKILVDQFHVSKWFMGLAIPVVYIIGDVGSVGGGWISAMLLKRGKSLNFARKSVMLVSASLVVPVGFVGALVDHAPIAGIPCVYWAIAVFSLAAAAHQGWSTNLFTLISDTAPKSSMAMAVGAINGFAMVGVSAMQFFVGRVVQLTSSYTIPFLVACCMYLVAFVFVQAFIPKVEPYPTTRRASIPWVIVGAAAILASLGYMQYATNRPPYATISDYMTVRRSQLHAIGPPIEGPTATVGWMQSRWYTWNLPDGKQKQELVKLDTHGHPYIEEKGSKATKYKGPK